MTKAQKNILFVLGMLAVFGFFYAISGDRAHQMPPDENHIAVTDVELCKGCHMPEGRTMVSEKHPPKFECLKCHKIKRGPAKK
ncbi:MAG: hypothetical protein HY807_08965 [Nitrospirae bacterium]|nr:hypothetical protein [Nitrospirota bacterium]